MMFKVKNENTRTTSMTFSSVSIINFEQMLAGLIADGLQKK